MGINKPDDQGALEKEHATELHEYKNTLKEVVEMLIDYRERGESVFFDFKGHKLYSADVTMDSAFLEVTGKNKADSDKAETEWRENYRREQEEASQQAKAKIPGWIEMGKTLGIDPSLLEEWEKMVNISATDLHHGMEIDAAIEVMQKLNDGASAEDIKKTLDDQGNSGASYSIVCAIINHFSPHGKDILEEINKREEG